MDELRRRSWCWILRHLILPVGGLAFGQNLMKRLQFLEAAQWWDRERLNNYRRDALGSLLRVAYEEVPFYRNLMETSGVAAADAHLVELTQVPVVTKDMFRAAYPDLTTRKTGGRTYEVSSSGSTGTNFRVMEDSETAGLLRATVLLNFEWAGWHVGEPHLQTGITLKRSIDRKIKDALFRCHYVSAYDLSDAHLDSALDVLESRRIQYLFGYPGSLYWLAQRAAKRGWNTSLRSIVTWGDNLYSHYRRTIESVFRARIFDTYGCGEGMQIAAQCGATNAYHIHVPDVIVECLDDNGRPVPAGELGNLVLTRLHPGAMPLIRYKIGDVGIMGTAESCACGRSYDMMDSIQGRDTDIVVTPSGNRLIVHFFTGILEHFPEIDCFQVIQDVPDSIVVRVVPAAGFNQQTASRVVGALQEKGARDLRIDVEAVNEIPVAPSGKRRFVIAKPLSNAGSVTK
jgi:phenylacetate-CoA ligase